MMMSLGEKDQQMNLKISIFMRLVVCHAELNAVLNRNEAHSGGCTLFTTMFPCNECAKVIIQAGIKEVVYYSDKKNGTESNQAAKYLFNKAGVSIRKFTPTNRTININLN
ncbi:hypothetical protein MS3_00006518 [Schistosoma haematobium]|uniref:dCMP deaminase n=1 Tax=Schistosoma haematobium TaxID=6185 RepID=A0A922IRV2_SCHHA|nr:hypothetical protein MS3_00006518 [Schistosoma haematobium]KAH9585175.1 hypothetical protein MS3_00006518 [Schistosoma haematobium]